MFLKLFGSVFLVAAFALGACGYGPPEYRGTISSVTLVGEGQVAIGYSRIEYRQPKGLTAFPDGGSAKVLYDQLVIALVDLDGSTRQIAKFDNLEAPAGPTSIQWFDADPDHLYVMRQAGQRAQSDTQAQASAELHRLDLNGRVIERFSLAKEMAGQGRRYTAPGFGLHVVDSQGTMLAGATFGGAREIWRRDPSGAWVFLDQFERDVRIVGEDVAYQLGDDGLARNWRTGDVRRVWRFNRTTGQSEIDIHGDPTLPKNLVYRPNLRASHEKGLVRVLRDQMVIARIRPDFSALDRR